MAYFNQDNNRRDSNRSFGGRRDSRGGGRGGDRQMYPAVCAECGRDCQVPFFPDGSKPVYCSSCFEHQQGGRGRDDYDARRPNRSFGRNKGAGQDVNKELLVSINSKLGKILELMSKDNKAEANSAKQNKKEKVKSKPSKKEKTKKKTK